MKKALLSGLMVAVVMMMTGCAKGPAGTAQAFLEDLAKGDIEAAKKNATEQTGQLLAMASSMGSIPANKEFKFILVEEKVDGDKAVVKYKEKADGEVEEVNLVKVDGKWKVAVAK